MRIRVFVLVPLTLLSACGGGDSSNEPSDTGAVDSITPIGDEGVDASDGTSPTDAPPMDSLGDVPADGTPGPCGASTLASWADGATFTRDLHVQAGAAAGGDGTAAKPFATIKAGFSATKPGDRLIIHAGTYAGDNYGDLLGTASKPILVTGAPGEAMPKISGGSEGLHFTDASYLIVQDLEITGQTSNGMNIDDGGSYDTPAHHIVLRRLWVHDIDPSGNHDGIKLSGMDDALLVENRIGKVGGQMMDMVGCHRVVVARNTFADGISEGVQMKGGCADNVVTRNLFKNVGTRSVNAGGSTDLPYFRPIDATYEAARLTVSANVFVGSETPIAFVGCDACNFLHNTVINPTKWAGRILQETTGSRFVPCRKGRYIDNIVVLSPGISAETINVGSGTDAGSFTFANNLWFHTGSPSFKPALPSGVTETASVYGSDPLLVDLAKPDAHLKAGSPAVAKGQDLGKEVPADHDGACWKTPPAIGALEN